MREKNLPYPGQVLDGEKKGRQKNNVVEKVVAQKGVSYELMPFKLNEKIILLPGTNLVGKDGKEWKYHGVAMDNGQETDRVLLVAAKNELTTVTRAELQNDFTLPTPSEDWVHAM